MSQHEELASALMRMLSPERRAESLAKAEMNLAAVHTMARRTVEISTELGTPQAVVHFIVDHLHDEGMKGAVTATLLDILCDFLKRSFEEDGADTYLEHMTISVNTVCDASYEAFKEKYDPCPE